MATTRYSGLVMIRIRYVDEECSYRCSLSRMAINRPTPTWGDQMSVRCTCGWTATMTRLRVPTTCPACGKPPWVVIENMTGLQNKLLVEELHKRSMRIGMVIVGEPKVLEHAVDSPQAFDRVAHAALSFADDEGLPVGDAAWVVQWGDNGWHVSRQREACDDCGAKGKRMPCPYASDVKDDNRKVTLCDECARKRAEDI